MSLLERHKKKSFLHWIVTGDEKWIHYDNAKRKKSCVKPGQPAKSTAKPNIHGAKVMLCILLDQKGVLYYELLKPGETINGERYRTQLIRFKRAIAEKRLKYVTRQEAIIFHYDNARPHVAIPVKNYLENSGWEVLPTCLIAQTLTLLTTICSGRCRTPSLEYGSHQNTISKIGLIHSWPPSRRSSFGMESTNCQKNEKKS